MTGHLAPIRGEKLHLYSISTSVLERGGWSALRPGIFTPGKDPVPLYRRRKAPPEFDPRTVQTVASLYNN
jgi:hypothetical protein